jgi:hypothetical protein
MTREQAYYIIGRVISLSRYPEGAAGIPQLIPKDKKDWNQMVSTGSDNLVLPSFYLALEKNKLLEYIPNDLSEYLKEVFALNTERNKKILAESLLVNRLLKDGGIQCVFMKGVANLMDGLYAHVGERMIYDIDIIVPRDLMVPASELLLKNGYVPVKKYNPRTLASTMHYPLLIREGSVAGIEIHRLPTQYLYMKALSAEDVFRESVNARNEKEVFIMGHQQRMIHNFIHAQLMHNGHYHASVSLRDLYDLFLLGRTMEPEETLNSFRFYRKQSGAYLKLMQKVFDHKSAQTGKKERGRSFFLWRHTQVLRMSRSLLRKYHFSIMIIQKYILLPVRILWNPMARNYVFSRLAKRTWYIAHFKSIKRIWKGF